MAFRGESGTYDVQITTLTETDGESEYELAVNGKVVGVFTNPPSTQDYQPVRYVWNNVAINKGDTVRVAFNSASNGKIPEGDGFAFSRGRFTMLTFAAPGTVFSWLPEAEQAQAAEAPVAEVAEGISLDKVPEVVIEAAHEAFPGGEINKVKQSTKGGEFYYKLKLSVGGNERKIAIFPSGELKKDVVAAPGGFPEAGEVQAVEAEQPESEPFVFDFDPAEAKKIFEEVDGMVAVEAEHYAE